MVAGGGGLRRSSPSSLLVGDASLPGGQHVVEGVSADAGPGRRRRRRSQSKDSNEINNKAT